MPGAQGDLPPVISQKEIKCQCSYSYLLSYMSIYRRLVAEVQVNKMQPRLHT